MKVHPEVVKVTINILAQGKMNNAPIERMVDGLVEEGLCVLSCDSEILKGAKLKGSLLKEAREALEAIKDEGYGELPEEGCDEEKDVE